MHSFLTNTVILSSDRCLLCSLSEKIMRWSSDALAGADRPHGKGFGTHFSFPSCRNHSELTPTPAGNGIPGPPSDVPKFCYQIQVSASCFLQKICTEFRKQKFFQSRLRESGQRMHFSFLIVSCVWHRWCFVQQSDYFVVPEKMQPLARLLSSALHVIHVSVKWMVATCVSSVMDILFV